MIECPKCGFANQDGTQFCQNPKACGTFLGYEAKRVETLPGTVTLTLSAVALAAAPGALATLEVRVRNKSTIVDQYSVDVVGEPAQWSTVQPSTLSLFPDKEGTATILFRPPRSSTVTAGRKIFSIKVQSKASAQISAEQGGAIEVAPFSDAVVAMTPRTGRGGESAVFRAQVQNKGNAPLEATLEATDPDEVLLFEFDRPALRLAAGEVANVQLLVRVRATFYDGPPQPHGFKLQLVAPGVSQAVADGTFMQEPVPRPIPRKFPLIPVLAAIVLLALLSGAFVERDPLMQLLSGKSSGPTTTNTGGSAAATQSASASASTTTTPTPTASASAVTLVTIPNVTCMSEQQAQQTLSNAGLVYVPNFVGGTNYPRGIVFKTEPLAGGSAPQGSQITALVSTGQTSTGIVLNPCLILRISPGSSLHLTPSP